MAIKCGNRKVHGRDATYHKSVDAVRACFQGRSDDTVEIPGLPGVRVPRKAPAFDTETLEEGFYALPIPSAPGDFHVFKVIVAVHGSGRKYAKRLNTETGEWEHAPGRIRDLRPNMRMTLKQALAVAKSVATDVEGRLYGRCFVCGRTLTKEESIDRMMGDICAGKFA